MPDNRPASEVGPSKEPEVAVITRRAVATLQAGLLAIGATAVTLGTGLVAYAAPGTPACPAASVSGNTATVTCNYTGGMQTWTVPAGIVSATFHVFGAQAGGGNVGGGNGGEATATTTVVPGALITAVVGGRGQNVFGSGAGGYNGGGAAGSNATGSSGGGASDVRVGGVALAARVLVAGGGGGAGTFNIGGGAGGGLSGAGGGSWIATSGGGGGTQVGPGGGGSGNGCCGGPGTTGSSGIGGNGGSSISGIGGGGGGGGYYGGGGGGDESGGGGGSGFGPVGTTFATGNHGGNGVVTITYTLRSTSVGVICAPSSTTVGVLTTCTATVTDTDSGTTVTPGGTMSFVSNASGTFNHTTCPNGTPTTTPSSMSCPVDYTPTALGTGTHTISVTYGGDLSTVSSSSSGVRNFAVAVAQGLTTTALASSSSSAVVGQPVTYTASISVTSPGIGAPTGTFAFTDNGTTITGCGAKTIGGGSATCSATYLSPATHPILATYSGDTNFATSSHPLTQSIVAAATTTALGSSSSSALVGQPVTYTASISVTAPGSGSPTGTLAFTDNGTTISGCGAISISAGTCSATYLVPGTHPILATYSGDTNYLSSSHPLTETIVTAATTTALGSSATSSVVGESITLTAIVSVTAPGGGTPAGTVAFSDGSTAVTGCAASALNGSGVATCTAAPATVGSHSFTATYSGSGSHGTSTSPVVVDAVFQASTATALGSSSSAAVVGEPVTYTASIGVAPPGSGSPTGTVAFTDNGTTITGCGAVVVTAGSATCAATYLSPGTHPILATYSGDTNFIASSHLLTQAVSRASTSVTVSASPAQSTAGDPVTISITVKAVSPGTGNPTGTVTVVVDGTAFGTVALDSTVDSLAVLTTTALASGPHKLTALYGGDANYAGVVSAVAATVAVVPVVAVPTTGAGLRTGGPLGLPELGIVLMLYGAMAVAWAARRRIGGRR
jgi:hypothetical protein